MSNLGWVKIHRKILDNPIAKKPSWAWLWVFLLLKANHEDNRFIFNNQETVIKRGQLLTGLKVLSKESGVTMQSIRSTLEYLKSTNQITIKTTNKFSVITILNYEHYQEVTSKLTNQQQTSNKPATTNKNDKNDKNIIPKGISALYNFTEHFNASFHTKFSPTEGRRKKLALRMKSFKLEQILAAVSNLSKSPFHTGKNDRGWTADPDFILRSDEQIDKWLEKDRDQVEKKEQKRNYKVDESLVKDLLERGDK